MGATKKCKYCQTEIDKKAKICPNCKKKQRGKGVFIVLGIIVFFIIVGALGNNKDDSIADKTASQASADVKDTSKKADPTAKPTDKPIEYTTYKVSELMTDLDSNAMKAENKYKKQYVELTGKLYNIDSSGKYIDLGPTDDEFTIIGVQCYIKNDEQKDKVMEMSKGDTVTLKGKITSVGEIMGYSLDIDEIE